MVQKVTAQPSAIVQPSVQTSQSTQQKVQVQQKVHVAPTIQQPPSNQPVNSVSSCDSNGANQDVECLLGQLLEDNTANPSNAVVNPVPPQQPPPQRTVHTIQLTPQKQQHLKSIQLQIQTLSARLTPGDTEMHNALKLLFQDQQRILASGKLLPPDKVYYHNNQLTIVNPTPVSMANIKTEQTKSIETAQITTSTTPTTHPRLSVTVAASQDNAATQTSYVNASPNVPGVLASQAIQVRPKLPQQQVRFLPSFTKAQL